VATTPGTLRCPSCGAPVAPETRSCPYCETALALVSCPSCFAAIFQGEKTDLEEERRRLHQEQYAHALRGGSSPVPESHGDPLDYGAILSAARDLLKGMFHH
jgi:hypothetical protein